MSFIHTPSPKTGSKNDPVKARKLKRVKRWITKFRKEKYQ